MNAILRYGWENIEHSIIACNLNEAEAKALEIKLIQQYESINPEKGYNKTKGGDTSIPLDGEKNGMYGHTHTEEARKKISDSAKHRFEDKANHPMYGAKRSEETKKKISKSRKGINAGELNYFYGKNMSGTESWRYGKQHSEETKQKLSEARKGRFTGADSYQSKAVKCVDTGEYFECAMDVKRKYGYDNSLISKCCIGKVKKAHGYIWEYAANTPI